MENTQNLPDYIVYTDGGCAINPGGHGAYAAIIIHTDTGEIEEYTNGYKNTTNNRMEIMAVIEAFEHIKKGTSVELHADSKYVLKTIDGQFSRKKNLDLWERLDKACEDWNYLYAGFPDIVDIITTNVVIKCVRKR